MQTGRTLATFWHGPDLPRLDQCCLLSFVRAGFAVTLYAYRAMPSLPDGLNVRDARTIAPEDYLDRFRIAGRPSLSHFTDFFRYKLFEQTDAAWVDTDILCLRPFQIPLDRHFLTRETDTSLNGALSRITRSDDLLTRLVAETTALADRSFTWGATGPALITRLLGTEALSLASPPHAFYPVHWRDWWKPFLPAERNACEALCNDSAALHLWNNIVERSGYWKDLAPPCGSFLHERFERLGLLGLFRDVLPESVMEKIVENDLNLRSAGHMPLKQMARIMAKRLGRKARPGQARSVLP